MKPSGIEFGGFIKMLRKRANLTVRELEDRSGVSHSYITQLENGKRGVPSPEILNKISEPLLINYDELMLKAGYINTEYSYQAPLPLFEGGYTREETMLALYVFGTNIKRLREQLGYNAEDIANTLSLSFEDYLRIETGTFELSFELIDKIAGYFEKNSSKLVHERTYFNDDDEHLFVQMYMSIYYKNKVSQDNIDQIKSQISVLGNAPENTYDINRMVEAIRDDLIVQIPIYGAIKAGNDFVAEQNIVGYKVASKKEVSDGEYFYLIVKGDSMIDEGIRENYKVLVRKQTFVENGKIGVIIINGDEATLKRVFYDGENVILQASNKDIPPRVIAIRDVMIQGQVKSVVFDV
ncbi:S24 family peptidase [Paenibacillus sp. FSL H7-0331]|uniref:helix-turn-helix domain-containing protein n=1 Tax=Paenibacillus sp. FSL H7-0331 TaxID=1920421 RepID=UPI00096BD0CF|nr:S24 family peptidase [Paenibacillus sp. FSL H7-0331]OME97331.1 hypothetical protein BK127_40945 [Paenibacillus sp. FSL H7-0331]